MKLHIFDIVMGIVFLIITVRGVFRGFVKEMMSMAAIIVGIAAAVFLSAPGAQLLRNITIVERGAQIIAFAVIFIAAFALVKLLELLFQKVLEKLNLKQLDRILGFVLGAIEGFLFICFIVFLLNRQPFFPMDAPMSGSLIYNVFIEIIPMGLSLLKEEGLHV